MTSAQRARFYFPAWNRALHANWRVAKGRVTPVPHRDEAPNDGLPTPTAVDGIAAARAARDGRAVTPDDLRHAVHVIALGQDISTDVMDNRQTDRAVLAFRILAKPDDLDAVMEYLYPANAERKRLLYSIEHSGLSMEYRMAVCRDRHGTPEWHSLDLPTLRQFAMTCRARARRGEPAAVSA